MRYENRLQRLEQHAAPPPVRPRIIRYLVAPEGTFGAVDKLTRTWFKRESTESEADFKARVTQRSKRWNQMRS